MNSEFATLVDAYGMACMKHGMTEGDENFEAVAMALDKLRVALELVSTVADKAVRKADVEHLYIRNNSLKSCDWCGQTRAQHGKSHHPGCVGVKYRAKMVARGG